MSKQTVTFPLRLPASLKKAVAEASREDGTSINQFVTVAVAEKLSAMKTADFFAERRARADVQTPAISCPGGRPAPRRETSCPLWERK